MAVRDRDFGYRDFFRTMRSGIGIQVQVGVHEDGGKPGRPDVAKLAVWHEFGTSKVPERSFLRSTLDENRSKYATLLQAATQKALFGAKTLNGFKRLGHRIVFDVQRKISRRIPPPNAQSTIDAKGSDIPLIDTGGLHTAIDYKVLVT